MPDSAHGVPRVGALAQLNSHFDVGKVYSNPLPAGLLVEVLVSPHFVLPDRVFSQLNATKVLFPVPPRLVPFRLVDLDPVVLLFYCSLLVLQKDPDALLSLSTYSAVRGHKCLLPKVFLVVFFLFVLYP